MRQKNTHDTKELIQRVTTLALYFFLTCNEDVENIPLHITPQILDSSQQMLTHDTIHIVPHTKSRVLLTNPLSGLSW